MILGIIPDGNRRWAISRRMKPWQGHKKGAETLRTIIEYLYERKDIESAIIYMFSYNNFKRSKQELLMLFQTFYKYFKELANDIINNGAKATIEFIGDSSKLPKKLNQLFYRLASISQGCEKKIYFVINYIPGKTVPPNIKLDLIIRTGNQNRLSGFIPECVTESEIFFRKEMWPDYTVKKLNNDISKYYSTERRLGA